MKPKPKTIVSIAFAGFMVTLVALVTHATWNVQSSNQSFDELERATTVHDAFNQVVSSATLAELHATRFIVHPNPEDRQRYEAAISAALEATTTIDTMGTASDRQRLSNLLEDAAPGLAAVQRIFKSLEQGETQAGQVPATGSVERVQARLEAELERSRDQVVALLADFENGQRMQQAVSLGAFALGLPVMLSLMFAMRHYERRETRTEVEMRRLSQAALTDSLTELGNHRAFQEELARGVAAARHNKADLALALVDVDRFKDVNDSEGHAKGDQILLQLGKLLQKTSSEANLFRIGGDEFAVILPAWDQEQALGLMESLRILAAEGLGGCTVSIGLAAFEAGDDGEILREKADIALYLAKRRGRNAVCVYSGEGGGSSPVTQVRINALRYLLQYASVNVAFQPIALTDSGGLVGFEALTRIPARFGLSGPEEAFDIAERMGRSYDLDMICLRSILARARDIPDKAVLLINLAPRTLEHAEFSVPELYNMVLLAGFDPERVCFELTERSSASIEVVQRVVGEMRGLGFRIALDDVGAGNSGLEMLRMIPVDYVKIDHSVVRGAIMPGAGRAVLMAIVAFASEAGSFVIAEGIEDEEMLRIVEETSGRAGTFRIHGVQGYLIGRPSESIAEALTRQSLVA